MKKVTVIGLGYVGLPLACLCLDNGYNVYGIDVDEEKVNLINSGKSPIDEFYLNKIVGTRKIKATTNYEILKQAEIIIVCVPTPVDKNHYPDLKYITNSAEEISKYLQQDQIIIFESTVNPGVSEEVVLPILNKSGLQSGKDFYYAHCPERIDPGNKKWNIHNIPRVVGATSQKGLEKVIKFYKSIIDAEIKPMKSVKEAEAVKIVENSFRDINIAFVNELAKSFDRLNIDIVDVIDGAATKPFAFMPHYPGCGVGGHCIPVDPYYLIEKAKNYGFSHEFLKLAREINNGMPQFTVDQVIQTLNKCNQSVNNSRIGILGLSYKPNVADTRESPSYIIIEKLNSLGAKLSIYDPLVPKSSNINSLEEILSNAEYLLLLTGHKQFSSLNNIDLLSKNNIKAVIDGRNFLDIDNFRNSKIIYNGIGR